MWVAAGVAGAWVTYDIGHFLLGSPEMELIHPDQVALSGNRYVVPASVREIFAGDRGKSVLRIPLDERRREIETLPWVEQAAVRRALPNKIQIDITERTPIAFVRESSDLALIDAHGVILDRPVEGDFHFPVVTGIDPLEPLPARKDRMVAFGHLVSELDSNNLHLSEQISEVDLTDPKDLRVLMAEEGADILAHFGNDHFLKRYQ